MVAGARVVAVDVLLRGPTWGLFKGALTGLLGTWPNVGVRKEKELRVTPDLGVEPQATLGTTGAERVRGHGQCDPHTLHLTCLRAGPVAVARSLDVLVWGPQARMRLEMEVYRDCSSISVVLQPVGSLGPRGRLGDRYAQRTRLGHT